MPKFYGQSPKRMGSARTSSLSASDVRSTVRRLGYVAARVHEVIMQNLIATEQVELAERVNDILKPAVDFLAHFELDDADTEVDDAPRT